MLFIVNRFGPVIFILNKLIDKNSVHTKNNVMGIISAGATDIGKKRKTNQDSFFISKEHKLFIVADGMGGHNGGDIASQIAVKVYPEYLIKNQNQEPVDLIKHSIKHANVSIKQYGETHTDLVGMGTTIVSFYFKGQNLYVGNVGDSRAYLISNHKIFQLTRDHSLVQEKLNYGVYDREQAALDPQKNVLVRTVGFDDDVEVDVFTYKVIKNDIFLCCSDGLHGKVSDEDMVYIVNEMIPNPAIATQELCDQVVKTLIGLANENGGQDNITVILVVAQ
jgi:serine/threonine protein phosphatase PrpC